MTMEATARSGSPPPSRNFEPAFATAIETAEAIRQKTISAAELLDHIFRRVERHNPAINAIVWQCRQQAVERARHADGALAEGKVWGSLHGVPVTIKEAFAYRGSPNAWGMRALEHLTSARTAVAVERLEAAGAIVIGKT